MAELGQITSVYGAESGHWYEYPSGKPAYTIIGKNTIERPTTLRDARKLGLRPGVTTILKEAAKPGLESWKQKQVLMAALTLPRLGIDGESEDQWIARIIADSKEQAIKAAERGTLIHAWIQQGMEGKPIPPEAEPYLNVVLAELSYHGYGGHWLCEQTFCTKEYGGKVDLHQPKRIVIDIKTKDVTLDDIQTFDDHAMQVGAYQLGLDDPDAKGGILFVSTKDISAKLVMIPEKQLLRGRWMFSCLRQYWYAKTGLTYG